VEAILEMSARPRADHGMSRAHGQQKSCCMPVNPVGHGRRRVTTLASLGSKSPRKVKAALRRAA